MLSTLRENYWESVFGKLTPAMKTMYASRNMQKLDFLMKLNPENNFFQLDTSPVIYPSWDSISYRVTN